GTYRDVEVRRSAVLSHLIGDLMRDGTGIPLSALSRDNAAEMIESRVGERPGPRLVSDIYQATSGNPLFIDGLSRGLAAEGRFARTGRLNLTAFTVPNGVREAIRRWLTLLPDRSILLVAAGIGDEFELGCLQRVTEDTRTHLLDELRVAHDVGLVVRA